MTPNLNAVASRRGGAVRRAVLASGLLAMGTLPAFAESRITQDGAASFYGREHHGGPTSSGERFDMNAMTAAHRTAPLGSRLKVTNLKNGKSVVVRINDRGPFVRGRIIDLSRAAASELGFIGAGITRVHIETAEAGAPIGAAGATRLAAADPVTTGALPARAHEPAHEEKTARAGDAAPVLDERDALLIARSGATH